MGESFLHWRNKNSSGFSNSKGFKIFKNPMQNLQFLKILKEILNFFQKSFKFYRNFRENLSEN